MSIEENVNFSFLYYMNAIVIRDDDLKLEIAFIMWKRKEEYTNNLQLVTLIDLSSNNLAGEIPCNITKLVGLVGLNFSRNNLLEPIPEDIGDLSSLNFLDFSRNNLSGRIPANICELSSLGVLDLSHSALSGEVPQCTQLLTFNESTYIENPSLCGHPLNISCPKDDDGGKGGNARSGPKEPEDDQFITEGFYIAMGLGFVVGFWGIFGTMLLSTSFRYALFKAWNNIEDYLYVRVELRKAHLRRHFQDK